MSIWLRIACLALSSSPAIWGSTVATAGPFDFHSNSWLNLHHFLYEQAIHRGELPDRLSAAERTAWLKALEFYRHSMIVHDLLLDTHMRSIDTELAEDETLPKLVVNGADRALWDTLNSVAAIYQAHWWPSHDEANRKWIAAAVPLARQYSPALMTQFATAYQVTWPRDPIRVDISEFANWAGAYTYTYGWGTVHEIISSTNPAYQGYAALEMLFHEATHGMVNGESGHLAEQIARQAKAARRRAPKDVVHIFIFYTAGELTRRDLVSANVKDYLPYADKKALYREDWLPWRNSLQVYWKQHLDGTLSLDDAIAKVVNHVR